MTIAVAEFQRAAQLCVQHSERTYPQFINGQGLAAATRALRATEKADANRIAYELAGNVRTRISVSKKTGKTKAVRQYDVIGDALAARIVNARRHAKGQPFLWGKTLARAARKMIAARLRAVAFIRSGWVYAIRTLSASVGYGAGSMAGDAARMKGVAKGYARPAKFAVNSKVVCEIANTALLEEKRSPMPVAMRGLEAGLRETSRDMLAHLAKKLQPVLNQYSAR